MDERWRVIRSFSRFRGLIVLAIVIVLVIPAASFFRLRSKDEQSTSTITSTRRRRLIGALATPTVLGTVRRVNFSLCPRWNLFAAITVSSFAHAAEPTPAAAPSILPPPEMTEYWSPVPPVVTAKPETPPSDAIVLFDGTNLDAWKSVRPNAGSWKIEEGAMVIDSVPGPKGPSDQRTKQTFGDIQLHLEFRTPAKIEGESQGRGNSGVFFMGLYELQILDSYENPTYVNGQAGSVYKQYPPLVNAARPPGEWQVYDAVFLAPRFDEAGKVAQPARITAFHNGVLIQHDVVLKGPTVWRGTPSYKAHAAKLPLVLQDHGNPTAFRNIWVRELVFADPK